MRPRSNIALALVIVAPAVALAVALAAARVASADPTTPPASKPATPPQSAISAYYGDLARLGIIDLKSGNQETLEAELGAGEAALERGDLAAAASIFYGITDSPRYADFTDNIAYQNAEYDIIIAFAGGGADDEAMGYVERVLRRGPKAHYFSVAHRRAVDIALETRRYGEILTRLEAVQLQEPLPIEAQGERGYLVGRAAYEAGDLDLAEKQLVQVSRKSRLFSSAIYLRGVIRVRQGKLKEAVDVFCEIAQTADTDRYTFYVDDRYYGLKDLAHLGAARIAHEEKRFDDAYYHYFAIPDDSERLPEALFEATWSMYQKRELKTARQLNTELLKSFPSSPLAPEAILLGGYIELADCKFEEARKKFDQLSAEVRPLVDTIERARATVDLRKQMLSRALERAGRRGPNVVLPPLGNRPIDRVLGMLRVDPPLVRLNEAVAGLQREADAAPRVIDEWRDLSYRVATRKGQVTATTDEASRAALLVGEIRHLRENVRREKEALLAGVQGDKVASELATERLPQLDKADAELARLEDASRQATDVAGADADPVLRARLAEDLKRSATLSDRSRALADGWDKTVDAVAIKELLRVENELVRLFEKARLGKVDAVIGEKRLLEKEIEDISADSYMPRSIGRVFRLGLISDTEEYWPPEEEVWEDEFQNWK